MEVNCHLHPLDSIASKCKAALFSIEQSNNVKAKLLSAGCLAEKCILALNKARFIDGKGDPHGFPIFLADENLRQSLIARYRGNRLHILFKLAALYVVHFETFKCYHETKSLLNALLKEALIADFGNPVTFTEFKVLAVVGKVLMSPWLKKFYRDSDRQIHHLDGVNAVKKCLKNVQDLAVEENIALDNIETDFFGDKLDKSEQALWSNDPSPLFTSMFKAALVSTVYVITRQYKKYYELEKQMTGDKRKSLETAKTHNMDSEEVIGMFSAIKSKAPRTSLLFMSCKIKSKKNRTIQYLKALPEPEAQAVVTKAVSFAAQFRHCSKKSVKELQKELSARLARKLHKRDGKVRAELGKKFLDLA